MTTTENTIHSVDARTGEVVHSAVETSAAQVADLVRAAASAAPWLAALGREGRADLLDALATALESRRADIVAIADTESALGTTRLNGELTRTCFQLQFMGDVAREGSYLGATIDTAGDTPMGPRPDLRKTSVPLGPVAVFGASNFPLAFSVPGGDTASALAAGCPVVVKAHESHLGTSELIASVFASVLAERHAPAGVFGIVYGRDAGVAVVSHPGITAVGFTGSLSGGRALFDMAARREVPIPFYGELGSVNPLVVSAAAADERAEALGAGIAASMTLGTGQFCTKPGLFLIPDTDAGQRTVDTLVETLGQSEAGFPLNDGIRAAFRDGVGDAASADARVLFRAGEDDRRLGAVVLEASVAELIGSEGAVLRDERFGPFGVVVRYSGRDELQTVLAALPPALTGTAHLGSDDVDGEFISAELQKRSGRIVFDGYPTGVAVAWGMHHGGQFPASTVPGATSVGAAAITRWIRPVTYQDAPQDLLPDEIKDVPTQPVPRRIDGELRVGALLTA